jgi:PAS domain S-box-containing protein
MGVDITDKKKATEQLKESESKLREAWRMAKQGFWFWDIKTGQVEWSEEVYNIFQLDPDQFTPRIDSILELSPWPEERERDQELIRRAIKDHKQGTYEQRFLRPDGSIGYYFSTFQGIYDDNGELIAMRGTVQDITDRKRSEEELKQYRDQLEDLVKKRTDELEKANAELKEKNVELERFHDATVDREFRMKELRNRIEELEKKLAGQ